jgi:hypothetical protein
MSKPQTTTCLNSDNKSTDQADMSKVSTRTTKKKKEVLAAAVIWFEKIGAKRAGTFKNYERQLYDAIYEWRMSEKHV